MYTSTTVDNDSPIRAWRSERDAGHIWFGHQGLNCSCHSVTFAEAQRLIDELTRELAEADDADHAAMMRDSVRQD